MRTPITFLFYRSTVAGRRPPIDPVDREVIVNIPDRKAWVGTPDGPVEVDLSTLPPALERVLVEGVVHVQHAGGI